MLVPYLLLGHGMVLGQKNSGFRIWNYQKSYKDHNSFDVPKRPEVKTTKQLPELSSLVFHSILLIVAVFKV